MLKFIPSLFKKKKPNHAILNSTDSSSNLMVLESPQSGESEAAVPWYFPSMPYSVKQWMTTQLADRVDKSLGFNDEITLQALVDNVEYFLVTNKKLTKKDKRKKIASLFTAAGVKKPGEIVDLLFDKMETNSTNQGTTVVASPKEQNLQRKAKQVDKESSQKTPQLQRQRSSTLF